MCQLQRFLLLLILASFFAFSVRINEKNTLLFFIKLEITNRSEERDHGRKDCGKMNDDGAAVAKLEDKKNKRRSGVQVGETGREKEREK